MQAFKQYWFLFGVFFCFILSSCEKMVLDDIDDNDSDVTENHETHEGMVALRITPFVGDQAKCSWKVTRASVDASANCNYLYAVVFDKDGNVESEATFNQSNMNEITLYMSKGHNHRVALLGTYTAGILDDKGCISFDKLSPKTYYAVKDFRVSSSKEGEIHDEVTLVPVVASICLETQVYEQPVDITINVSQRSTKFDLYRGQGVETAPTSIQAKGMIFNEGGNHLKIQTFIDPDNMEVFTGDIQTLPQSSDVYYKEGSLSVSCKDSNSGADMGTVSCSDFAIAIRHTTTLTGILFSNPTAMVIKVDDDFFEGPTFHF